MESFLPLSGFQLPFQQRLSRLYNDTKKSTDFVKDPVQNEEDPEVKALHRKLRIQKDRLVSWGLEWSDPTQSAEIDESLSKAGLSEVVGSIMSTIKDILAEAEPLWLSSKHLADGSRSNPDRKPPLAHWDKTRFEDLVRDLTSSIDTLYEISRTRSMAGGLARGSSKTPYKGSSAVDDFRPFESSRIQTPQLIRSDTLTHLRSRTGGDGPKAREVVFMSKTAYLELTQGSPREPWAPLLLEYAHFDPIYSVTGVMPSMSRFEKLSAGLQQDPQRSPETWTGLPRLLGYFEDMDNSRFGLVYRFPHSFNAVSFEQVTKNPYYSLPTLGELLTQPDTEPALEAKFRLAHNLANTVFDMHARGITHGGLGPQNVSFTNKVTGPALTAGDVDVRRPLVSSYELFPEESAAPVAALTRHPLDPRSTKSPSFLNTDERVWELYSLAMILLTIGLWTPLEELVPENPSKAITDSLLQKLAIRCGSPYMKAVQACLSAVDTEQAGECTGEVLLSSVQMRASRFLEACCILDGVGGLEERLTHDLHQTAEETVRKPSTPSHQAGPSKDPRDIKSPALFNSPQPAAQTDPSIRKEPIKVETVDPDVEGKFWYRLRQVKRHPLTGLDASGKPAKPENKIKLYPNVPLPPDAVEKWNTILMPQINHALRHFYRKNPESVEISLESVGPNPANTQPTVLVVCTSVGKVRAILKKRLGDLFDGSTGFALKVCKGHVLRSRRHSASVIRSMANRNSVHDKRSAADGDDEVEAVNPEFQERPGNGASIGAWIGDRHLPPVSFGGLVLVDDKIYGMTVHHMLDDPERDFGHNDTTRSSAIPNHEWFSESLAESSVDDEYAYELSDTESEPYSESDITSDWGDDEEDEDEFEPGDIPGIEPGCGDGYIVTQPALDDVEDGFYPSEETADEDHLDTFSLGEVYASSGIRRKQVDGLVHEVDWALFEFASDRTPDDNLMPRAQQDAAALRSKKNDGHPHLRPTMVAPLKSLPGMEVQCMARTSGLQTGQILPALTSVKIYGRASPSHTYQIASIPSPTPSETASSRDTIPIGIPGDSGAWVVDRHDGQLCGHVLAWSQRKHVAYICPMDVLLVDIAQTLEASEVRLPGGDVVVSLAGACSADQASDIEEAGYSTDVDASDDTPPTLVSVMAPSKSSSTHSLRSVGSVGSNPNPRGSQDQVMTVKSKDLNVLNRSMNDLRMDRGIGVSG